MPGINVLSTTGFGISITAYHGFANAEKAMQQGQTGKINSHSRITYRLISGISSTWGYDIYVDDKLLIHQPSRPALPGNEGFKTKRQSKVVAKLVIKKLAEGIMPPSVSVDDLRKAKII